MFARIRTQQKQKQKQKEKEKEKEKGKEKKCCGSQFYSFNFYESTFLFILINRLLGYYITGHLNFFYAIEISNFKITFVVDKDGD